MSRKRLSLVTSKQDASPSYTDADFIAGVHAQDQIMFAEMVRAYLPGLTRFAFSLLGGEEEAHDVVQDVFARVWVLATDWKPRGTIAQYLFTAVRNRSADELKSIKAHARLEAALSSEITAVGTGTVAPDEPHDTLPLLARKAALNLTDRQREALHLRYTQEQTMPEVAAVLGINVTAAEKLVSRALAGLRELLKERL